MQQALRLAQPLFGDDDVATSDAGAPSRPQASDSHASRSVTRATMEECEYGLVNSVGIQLRRRLLKANV